MTGMDGPHLDVLVDEEFSRFVADGLAPEIVVNASSERINLGVRSADGAVDAFVGDLSAAEARAIAEALERAAEVRDADRDDGGTWTAVTPDADDEGEEPVDGVDGESVDGAVGESVDEAEEDTVDGTGSS
jgi:hypothetical protein